MIRALLRLLWRLAPNPPKPPMKPCPHCRSMNEQDGRKNCRNCHQPLSSRATFHAVADLGKHRTAR